MKSEMQQEGINHTEEIGHRPLRPTLGDTRKEGHGGRLEREQRQVGQGKTVWEWREGGRIWDPWSWEKGTIPED